MTTLIDVATVFGPMFAFEGDLITRHMQDYGAHTRPEVAFLLSVVRSGDCVFDLGAHIGAYTIPLARKVAPEGSVMAVEAVPETFAVLTRNVARLGLSARVDLRCALVAPSTQYEPVADASNTGGTYFRRAVATWPGPLADIDTLATQTSAPDVIKTDLEGFDAWALCGSQIVKDRRPVIYAEISPADLARCGTGVSDLSELFAALGYRLFRNTGARHAAHDHFEVDEIDELSGEHMYDVLAVHGDDARLTALLRST